MDWEFASETLARIAPWMVFIRAMQEQLPMDAGVKPPGKGLRRVSEVNSQFMCGTLIVLSSSLFGVMARIQKITHTGQQCSTKYWHIPCNPPLI